MRQRLHKSVLLCLLTGVLVFSCILPVLAEKTTEQKLAELAELELQYNTMSGKINYTASQEYLLRYAREYLGYLLPGDIRIDVDNPDAPVPTAQLPLVTARPTPSPEPTGTPEV